MRIPLHEWSEYAFCFLLPDHLAFTRCCFAAAGYVIGRSPLLRDGTFPIGCAETEDSGAADIRPSYRAARTTWFGRETIPAPSRSRQCRVRLKISQASPQVVLSALSCRGAQPQWRAV